VSIIVVVKNTNKQVDHLNPAEGSNICLRNTGFLLQGYTLSQPSKINVVPVLIIIIIIIIIGKDNSSFMHGIYTYIP
jgi:hypothetical protein